ncbi:MAG TPA: lumazine-binding protein [Mycobacterium sp.]|nr:lumazine-binding protein [Mycobacterium sp.]
MEPVIGERRTQDDENTGATPWPFLGALTLIVVVVAGIWLVNMHDRGADSQREAVVRAALGQNDGLQRLNYADVRANTCAQLAGTEADVLARQRESVAQHGARYVDNVTGVTVDGDHATAKVIYYFANAKDNKITVAASFVREDGTWRLCTAGP